MEFAGEGSSNDSGVVKNVSTLLILVDVDNLHVEDFANILCPQFCSIFFHMLRLYIHHFKNVCYLLNLALSCGRAVGL